MRDRTTEMLPVKLNVQRIGGGKNGAASYRYWLVLHPSLGRHVPEGARFLPEFTEEGILFRRVERPDTQLPTWAKEARQRQSRSRRSR